MLQLVLLGVLVVLVVFVVRQIQLVGRSVVANHARRTGRLVAVCLLGTVCGIAFYVDHARGRADGRAAFLEMQTRRFDGFISKPHDLVPEVLTGIVLCGAAVGAYELVAWVVYLMLRPAKKEGAA